MESTISELTEQRNTTGEYGKSSTNASSTENQYQRKKSLASGKRMRHSDEDDRRNTISQSSTEERTNGECSDTAPKNE